MYSYTDNNIAILSFIIIIEFLFYEIIEAFVFKIILTRFYI